MKTYYGTKVITAQPITRKEYNDLRGWEVPLDEDGSDEGYLVCYPDQIPNVEGYNGYVSWSPADIFEGTYKEIPGGLQPHQTRVVIEHSQLVERAEGLESFIGSDNYFKLPEVEQKDLSEQLEAMIWYRNVLERRMSRF